MRSKLAAILSIPDISGGVSGSYTDNTRLPVNLFPAEVFGGPAGTYREVQTGIRYTTSLNENVEVKLINPRSWKNLRLARLDLEAATADRQLQHRTMLQNLAASYFNIVTLLGQRTAAERNLAAADTLQKIAADKYREGLIRQQDVNESQANSLATGESLRQIDFALQQQYLALKVLADIPDSLAIIVEPNTAFDPSLPAAAQGGLSVRNRQINEQIAWTNYRQARQAFLPTLSFVQSYSTNRYSSQAFFKELNARFIPSNYIGLRLNILIPGSSTIAQASKTRFEWLQARNSTEQERLQSALENRRMSVDYEKAISQWNNTRLLLTLYTDTYSKNLLLYREGLISLGDTLTSFNNLVNATYDEIAAAASVQLAKTKIDIHNQFQ